MEKLDKIDRMLITHNQLVQVFKTWLEEWAAPPERFEDFNFEDFTEAEKKWPEGQAETFERIFQEVFFKELAAQKIAAETGDKILQEVAGYYPLTEKDERIILHARMTGTPIFVLTAKDKISAGVIASYRSSCIVLKCKPGQAEGARVRLKEFVTWQKAHPDLVKLPD